MIKSDLSIQILKEPDNNVSLWLNKLIWKYRNDFKKGIYKEKISYEC